MEWVRTRFDGLDGLPKYRYSPKDQGTTPEFWIEASRKGVELKGNLVLAQYADLQPFAKAIGDAWKDHRKFMPNLGANLAGH
jgi:hypothetical protein